MSNPKNIKVKSDPVTKESYLDVQDFSDYVDTKKVKYYTLETIHDDSDIALILKFYDKNKKVINGKN